MTSIKELKNTEEKFRSLVETTSDWIWEVDRDGIYTYSNPKVKEILGYEVNEIIGKTPFDFMPPDEANRVFELFQKAKERREPIKTMKNTGIHKNGKIITLETSGVPFYDECGNLMGYRGIDRDISEKIEVEKKLKVSEEKYRSLSVGLSQTGIGIDIIDSNHNVVYQNQYLIDLFGEPQGRRCFEFFLEREEPCEDCPMMKAIQNKKVEKGIINAPNNRVYEIISAPLLNPTGTIEKAAEVIIDITERKKSEDAIKLEKKFTEDLINASNDTIFVFNPQTGKTIRWNKAFSEVSGYTNEEISSMKAPDSYYNEEDLKCAMEATNQVIEGGSTKLEMSLITKNGKSIPFEYSGTLIKDTEGNLLIISIGRDISERKVAELKLKESEEKYRALFENMNAGFAYHEVIADENNKPIDYIYREVNPAFEKLTGLKKENLIGKRVTEAIPGTENDPADWIGRFGNVGLTGVPITVEDYSKALNKWFRVSGYSPKKGYFAVTFTDITDIKRADQKIRESEERYRLISEASNSVVWTTDMNLNLTYVSSNSPNILGYTAEESKSLLISSRITPASLEKMGRILKEEFRSERKKDKDLNRSRTFETDQIHKDGSIIPIEITFTFLRDRDGKAIGILGVSRDISEHKKSYEKLKELEYIINNSPSIVFLWKNAEGWPVEYVSENITQFGYTPEEFYSGEVIYSEIIHPEDIERVSNEVQQHSHQDITKFEQEYRILTKSGEIKWIDDRTWIRRDLEGNISHFQGIVLDITDRKKINEDLKLSEKRYKEAYATANFYKDLFTHDMNNILQIINSSAEIIGFQLGDSEKSMFIENMTKMIKSQVDRGSKLISDVRTLTELDEQEISLNRIDISKFLNSSIKFVSRAYSDRSISISVENLDQKYYTRANELLQDVFDNILINGIKYNENLNIEISIKISKHILDGNDYFKIEFSDNGIGVPDDRKKFIFQRGNRELKGTKGMGIGLSLVKKILEIYKGKVWVEDKIKGDYSKGSNFVLLLPEYD